MTKKPITPLDNIVQAAKNVDFQLDTLTHGMGNAGERIYRCRSMVELRAAITAAEAIIEDENPAEEKIK